MRGLTIKVQVLTIGKTASRVNAKIFQKILLVHLSSFHLPIMSKILRIHREQHYDEGEGDDVQFHVELRRVSSNWVRAVITSSILSHAWSLCSCFKYTVTCNLNQNMGNSQYFTDQMCNRKCVPFSREWVFPKCLSFRFLLLFACRVTIGTEKSQVVGLPVPIHFRWLQRRRRRRQPAGKRDILSIFHRDSARIG